MCYTEIMSDLTRILAKRAQLQELMASLSPQALASIYRTVETLTHDQKREYQDALRQGLQHSLISTDEYDWLQYLVELPPELLNPIDRIFLARISWELTGVSEVKLESMESPSLLRH